MKHYLMLLIAVLVLAACSGEETPNEAEQQDNQQEEAKQEEQSPQEQQKADKETVEEGGYIKYRGAEWTGEVNGLEVKVNSVSLTEDLSIPFPDYAHEVKDVPGVLIWLDLKNASETQKTADFLSSVIVLDSGEEVEIDTFLSTYMEEDVRPGTHKDGDMVFPLDPGTDIRNIKSIDFYFEVIDENGGVEEGKAELQLQ